MRVFHSERELAASNIAWKKLAVLAPFTPPEFTDVQRLERRIREAAGKLGANGVIEPDLRDLATPGGPMLAHPPGSIRVVAIRWWIIGREPRSLIR